VRLKKLEKETLEREQVDGALRESKEKYRKLYEKTKRAEEIYQSFIHSSADAIIT
jgi:hypothetical protein